jgi:hypothetical protein
MSFNGGLLQEKGLAAILYDGYNLVRKSVVRQRLTRPFIAIAA